MQQRRKLVVGNWKMNGGLEANAALLSSLVSALRTSEFNCDVAVCVPFPFLGQAQQELAGSKVTLGSQNVSEFESGAYTGEVSASMLKEFGCRYAIVGHSERRMWFGDTDERVAAKAERAIATGLTAIVCVGETLAERERGRAAAIVEGQLDAVLERLGAAGLAKCVVAYEPVWAIGTGKTASPDEAQAMHAAIRAHVVKRDKDVASRLTILYGGSVKAGNAAALFESGDIDGGLIGGASLIAKDFMGIAEAASAAARSSTQLSVSE
ncbi:MAG: triose-phosphate isomerase [Burkholderiaceae bacterium]